MSLINNIKAAREYYEQQRQKANPDTIDIDDINFDELFAEEEKKEVKPNTTS